MDEAKIKEAFSKAKQDISDIKQHIIYLHKELSEIKRTIQSTTNTSTLRQITSTDTDTSTDKHPVQPVSIGNKGVSTGNEGVSTDRQTNRQTDRHIQKFAQDDTQTHIEKIEKVSEVLESLDDLKKEMRQKFKKLTPQEMLIFSTLYQLEEKGLTVDYSLLSERLKLTESSIRDYIQRIIKKGVPVVKTKENNKKVTLSILQDLKKIASLSTIKQLRDL